MICWINTVLMTKPKGKTVNWYYLTTPSPDSQERLNISGAPENFDMMIFRLEVELEKVIPSREDLNGYRNAFTPKLPFKDIQIDMPQIKHQSLLNWLFLFLFFSRNILIIITILYLQNNTSVTYKNYIAYNTGYLTLNWWLYRNGKWVNYVRLMIQNLNTLSS